MAAVLQVAGWAIVLLPGGFSTLLLLVDQFGNVYAHGQGLGTGFFLIFGIPSLIVGGVLILIGRKIGRKATERHSVKSA